MAVPANAKRPQDHKSAGPITIEHLGETYEFSKEDIDLNVIELVEADKYVTAVKSLVGDGDFARFKASATDDNGKVPMAAFQEFAEKLFSNLPN